jgi:TRAP-type C4-dicarboxylate transport system permease small subunit
MHILRVALLLIFAALIAWAAGYYCALHFHPANTHPLNWLGEQVPGGQYASATVIFGWAFFIALVGMALVYKRLRAGRKPSTF